MTTRHFTRHLLILIVFVAIAAGMLIALLRLSGALSFGGTYNVKAIVPSAGSLAEGSSVTMAGTRVGTVKDVERRGVGALVNIRLDDDAVFPLPKDSGAKLAVRTPLGENYVEIEPGRSKETLPEGSIVPPVRDDEYVDVDQLLSVLQDGTREETRKLIGGLGTAVDGRGRELSTTLDRAAGTLQAGSSLTRALDGDGPRIARLVRQLGSVMTALGERRASIEVLARQGRTTFTALAARDDALRRTIEELPSTLRQARETTGVVRDTSATATPVVANLATALREVRPAVRSLTPAAAEGRRVVARLSSAAPPLQRALAQLDDAAPKLTSALPEVRKVLCQVNPMLRYIEPYKADIVSFVTSLGSAANSYDAIGHTIRLMPVVNETALMGLPKGINDAVHTLVSSGLAQGIKGMSFDPFPAPGQAEKGLKPGEKTYAGPDDIRKSGWKYPRIVPEC